MPVDVDVPIQLDVDVPLNETVPVQAEVPLNLNVPVQVDVAQTELTVLTDQLAEALRQVRTVVGDLAG